MASRNFLTSEAVKPLTILLELFHLPSQPCHLQIHLPLDPQCPLFLQVQYKTGSFHLFSGSLLCCFRKVFPPLSHFHHCFSGCCISVISVQISSAPSHSIAASAPFLRRFSRLNCLHFFTCHLCFNLLCSGLCPHYSIETTLDKVSKDLMWMASVRPSCPHPTLQLISFPAA